MTKNQTKADLQRKVDELEKVIKANGLSIKDDTLIGEIERIELSAQDKVMGIIRACERKTGRKWGESGVFIPEVKFKINFDTSGPLRDAVKQLVKYAKNGTYSFKGGAEMAAWVSGEIKKDW